MPVPGPSYVPGIKETTLAPPTGGGLSVSPTVANRAGECGLPASSNNHHYLKMGGVSPLKPTPAKAKTISGRGNRISMHFVIFNCLDH